MKDVEICSLIRARDVNLWIKITEERMARADRSTFLVVRSARGCGEGRHPRHVSGRYSPSGAVPQDR